jgi:hypothetical protein
LSSNAVKSIYEDKYGTIWVGTRGGGLNKFNHAKQNFIHFTEKEGLSNNSIYAILGDNNDFLWISTNKGLSRFNLRTNKFINYDTENGLANDQFDSGYLRCKDGTMFFGGIGGLTFFVPEEIGINQNKPKIIITSFKKFNEEINFEKQISSNGKIELNNTENYISVEFAALDFTHPGKNQYAYKLEGLDMIGYIQGPEEQLIILI